MDGLDHPCVYGPNETGRYTIRATPGVAVRVPGGAPHGFKNVGETPGRMINIFSPAGIMERFSEEVGTPVGEAVDPPNFEPIMPAFEKYDLHLVEPLPVPVGEPVGQPA